MRSGKILQFPLDTGSNKNYDRPDLVKNPLPNQINFLQILLMTAPKSPFIPAIMGYPIYSNAGPMHFKFEVESLIKDLLENGIIRP